MSELRRLMREFLWEEDATHPILCGIRDADAESVTRRRTMGARGGRGQ